MDLNALLLAKNIDPQQVLVFRHRPFEPELNRVLPWLAAEKPDVFNAYQQTQGAKVEKAMTGASFVASFVGHEPGKALFIGLYAIGASSPLSHEEYWQIRAYIEMKKFGMEGFSGDRSSILWFNLKITELYASWKGKLIVGWPPPERSWWRRAHKNTMPIMAVLEESALDAAMPEWDELSLNWQELAVLTTRWKFILSQWRGIYYISDSSDGKGYVGSACGDSNLLGRWLNYAASGDGGNSLLRHRDPRNFRFSILQRVSPDENSLNVIQLEGKWKERLHTRRPFGLNDN